jgi:pyrroline-5-carboxylate reductase
MCHHETMMCQENTYLRFMMTDISKTIINKPTYISNIIKEVSDKGGDQSKIISTLATLPADTLKKAIKENDNILL